MAFIMIVDDAVDSCEPLAKYLEKSGHEVQCVPNGREALASVIARTPDVVVLDLLMPEMDGPSFLEVTRSYLRLQSLPVRAPPLDEARLDPSREDLLRGDLGLIGGRR